MEARTRGALRRAASVPPTVWAVALCFIVLLAGYLLKECPSFFVSRRLSLLCYSDIESIFRYRGLRQGPFPYIHGGLAHNGLTGGSLEYPVLTGVFMWLTAHLASDAAQYLMVSAVLLGVAGLLVAYLLARMVGWRALLWSVAPALVLFGFHNWDLLAVAASVAGFWSWWRGRRRLAAVWFGVGAALKLYPGLFLIPLAWERWVADDRKEAIRAAGAGVATGVLINLPFFALNPAGWLATYEYHGIRPPNIDSIWGLEFSRMSPRALNLITTVLILATFAVVLLIGHRRARRERSYPFVQVCAALVAAFLVWNKVHSPQYVLWILPFFALLRINVRWWAAYALNDLVLYGTIFYLGFVNLDQARPFLLVTVFARAALLLILIPVFLRARLYRGEEAVGQEGEIPHEAIDRRPRSRLSESKLKLWVGVAAATLMLLVSAGAITGSDGPAAYAVTRSIVEEHSLTVPQALGFKGRDGRYYASHGLGLPLIGIVPYALSRPVAALTSKRDQISQAAVASLMPIVAGLLVVAMYSLSRRLGGSRISSLTVAIGASLGTYLLPYLKDFYSEPLATLFVVLAIERALARRPTGSGMALAAAGLTRPQTFFLAPLLLWCLWRDEGRSASLRAGMAIAGGALIMIAYNVARFSNPFQFDPVQGAVSFGKPFLHGAAGLLFFPTKSLFLFAPIAILIPFAFRRLWSVHRMAFWLLTGNLVVTFVIAAAWPAWDGGWTWGPRLLLPGVIPAVVALAAWMGSNARRWALVSGLLVLGFLVSAPGVLVSTRAQLLSHPPPHGPSVVRQYRLVEPAVRFTGEHLFDDLTPERYLDLWQVRAARDGEQVAFLLALIVSALILGVVVWAGAQLVTRWPDESLSGRDRIASPSSAPV